MGVSDDGVWLAERIQADHLLPTIYEELSYPDELLSCAEREERGPVPQTVYSNIMAGATAAQLLIEALIHTHENFNREEEEGELFHILDPVKRILGENWESSFLSEEGYYLERMPEPESQSSEEEQ